MDSQKLTNSNETSELKSFMANMRKDSLIKLVESSQLHFKEKCNYLSKKLEQSQEEVQNKVAILQQNSHLIEKFQNKLQELSDQNTELLRQQEALQGENENLHVQLKCSEDKFAQLDILYDQKITDLSERNIDIEQKLKEVESCQEMRFDQLGETQTDLSEKLSKSEQRITDLLNELSNLEMLKKHEKKQMEGKITELNEIISRQKVDIEEKALDIQKVRSTELELNKKLTELKNELKVMQDEKKKEKHRLMSTNDNLKATFDDLKKGYDSKDALIDRLKRKLLTKEKESKELLESFKPITRSTKSDSLQSNRFVNNQQESPDDPKRLDDSSDSDASSVSAYKFPKRRHFSYDSDSRGEPETPAHFKYPSFGPRNKRHKFEDLVEVPESPVVSSSAFEKTPEQPISSKSKF